MSRFFLLCWFLLCALLAGCRVRSQIVVRVSTDMVQGIPNGELQAVRVVVRSPSDPSRVFRNTQFSLNGTSALPFLPSDVVLVKEGSAASNSVRVEVTAIGPRANSTNGETVELFTRTIDVSYVEGRVSLASVFLKRGCAELPPCGIGQSCTEVLRGTDRVAGCVDNVQSVSEFTSIDLSQRPDAAGMRDVQTIDTPAETGPPDVVIPDAGTVCPSIITLPAQFGTGVPVSPSVTVRRHAARGVSLAVWAVQSGALHRLLGAIVMDDGTVPVVIVPESGANLSAPFTVTEADASPITKIRVQLVGTNFLVTWIQNGQPRLRAVEWTSAGKLFLSPVVDPFGSATTLQDYFVTAPEDACPATCTLLVCSSSTNSDHRCRNYQWTSRVGLSAMPGFDSAFIAAPLDGVPLPLADAWSVLTRVDAMNFQHVVTETDGTQTRQTPWPVGGLPEPLNLTASIPAVYVGQAVGVTPARWVVPTMLGGANPGVRLYRQEASGTATLLGDLRTETGQFTGTRNFALVYFPSTRSWWMGWPQGTLVEGLTFTTLEPFSGATRTAGGTGVGIANNTAGISASPIAETVGQLAGLSLVGFFNSSFAPSIVFIKSDGVACR